MTHIDSHFFFFALNAQKAWITVEHLYDLGHVGGRNARMKMMVIYLQTQSEIPTQICSGWIHMDLNNIHVE